MFASEDDEMRIRGRVATKSGMKKKVGVNSAGVVDWREINLDQKGKHAGSPLSHSDVARALEVAPPPSLS
jgi:hypothetical protein